MSARARTKPGWRTCRFDEFATNVNERVDDPSEAGVDYYVGLEHLDSVSLAIRRWGSPAEVQATKLRFRRGDIIFGRRRVYQRKLGVAHFDGICSAHAMVLRPKPNTILPEFLPFFMQSDLFMERAKEISVGSLSPTINWPALAREEFPLPPFEEQKRIAAGIASIISAAEALRGLSQSVDAMEHAFLIDAFGMEVGSSPKRLSVVSLASVAEIRTGLAKGRQPDAETTTRPYLRVANVKDGELDLTEIKEIVVARDQIDRYTLRIGDVLMTEGGDLDKLGRGTVWQGEVAGCLHQNHVFAVRTDADKLDPWYLTALARSPYGRQYFLACAKRTSNLASVNKGQVGQFPVPLLPINEQKRWVQHYRRIRASAAHSAARCQSLDLLRHSLLVAAGLSR